jgi:hypothetical protein
MMVKYTHQAYSGLLHSVAAYHVPACRNGYQGRRQKLSLGGANSTMGPSPPSLHPVPSPTFPSPPNPFHPPPHPSLPSPPFPSPSLTSPPLPSP